MFLSFLFTIWIIVATVSSGEVSKESTETSMEDNDSSSDEKISSESNEEKDTSEENDSTSTEKESSSEDNSSAEKDSSSTEQSSSEENKDKDSDESSEEGRSYVVKKNDDKYTKTTQQIIKPGSNLPILPACAICNFQAGGVFIPWSIPCTGCSYRAPTCSPMGFCCVMNPECAKRPQGKPCPLNNYLGLPMQSGNSLVGNNLQNLNMVQTAPYASPMAPQIAGTSSQISPDFELYLDQNGKYVNPVIGKFSPGTHGLVPNNPVYQALGLPMGDNTLGGSPTNNPSCPSAKLACATLGGTCIPSSELCGGVIKEHVQLCGINCKCCIKSKNKECTENNKNCQAWASAGYCSTYPHIKANCKISCGICIPTEKETTIGPQSATSPYISNNCKDKIPNCKTVATSIACVSYPKMKELCPTTCGVPCTEVMSSVQQEGNMCNLLIKNTCTDVLGGHCIPLDETCGGYFKEDPTLCGDGNCKCCIAERCNIAPEDSAVCNQLGGKCISDPTKCRGSCYPLCGSNTCQCCVETVSDTTLYFRHGSSEPYIKKENGLCSVNQQCGNQGTCSLGGCQEGYELTEGQCPGQECYCCKKKVNGSAMLSSYGTCSDKKCGDGGTCRDITCLPGEVRLSENCGTGSCVCCKPAQLFDSPEESCKSQPCGNGGKCRCTNCQETEESIEGYCQKTDCLCCKAKTETKSDIEPATKSYTIPNSSQYPGPLETLRSYIVPDKDEETRSYIRPSSDQHQNDKLNTQIQLNEDSECRPPKNNRCHKKGGNCIPLNENCYGNSIRKFCGKSKSCQCCILNASFQTLPPYNKSEANEESVGTSNQRVEPAKEEKIEPINPPPFSFTDEKIESNQNIQKDSTELIGEYAQSKAGVNIEPNSEINNQNKYLDNEEGVVVDGVQSAIDDMMFLVGKDGSPIENQKLAETDVVSEFPTTASLESDITTQTSLGLDKKAEESILNKPSLTINTPMDHGPLVESPVIKDSMESNYEMNILPEVDMIDYYDSVNIPLDETESGLYSDHYYEMKDINSLIKNDKNMKVETDNLIDNTATDLNNIEKISNNLDNTNDKLSKNLDSSLERDLQNYYKNYDNMYIINNYDQIEKDSILPTTNEEEHIEKDSNTPNTDYYDQVEDSQPMDSGAYQSNYDMYTSTDDGYYTADYANINQYDVQYI